MKRFSIYFLFGFSILTAFIIFDYAANRNDWLNWYRNDFAHRADRLNDEAYVARSYYVATQDLDSLADLLESRRHMGAINFWMIETSHKTLRSSMTEKEIAGYKFDLSQNSGAILTDKNHHYDFFYALETLDSRTGESYKLVIGVRRSESSFLEREFDLQKFFMIRYICGIALLAFAIFVFFFRDVMKSIRWLVSSRRDGTAANAVEPHSREAALLQRSLESFDSESRDLKQVNQVLADQVLPSLKTELSAGRQPPYEFPCTLARMDLNHFSDIYAKNPSEVVSSVLSDFFIEASQAIERHGGLVHEFIGDEVIFYFKDEASPDATAMAANAIYAINEIAEKFNHRTTKNHGFPFTVKSTFASGTLRFGAFVGGFNITGAPLIETVRVLSEVNERDENRMVFDERHLASVKKVAAAKFEHEAQLKGLPKALRIHAALARRELKHVWDEREVHLFTFYRSDRDITDFIKRARGTASTDQRVRATVDHLRALPRLPFPDGAHEEMLAWIGDLLAQSATPGGADRAQLRTLASLIKMTDRFPQSSAKRLKETNEVLLSALEARDERVVANALETLMNLARESAPQNKSADPATWLKDPRGRVSTNALVWMAKRDFDRKIIRRIKQLLSSNVPGQRSSALYSIGEIAADYRSRDPVLYSAQTALLELVELLPSYCLNADENISAQALQAVRKIGDPVLIEKTLRLAKNAPTEFQRTRITRSLASLNLNVSRKLSG